MCLITDWDEEILLCKSSYVLVVDDNKILPQSVENKCNLAAESIVHVGVCLQLFHLLKCEVKKNSVNICNRLFVSTCIQDAQSNFQSYGKEQFN